MPIIVTLDEVLHRRRLSLTDLAERVGITLANLSILKTGKARAVRFSTLDRICHALECQPADILRWVPAVDTDPAAEPEEERDDDTPASGRAATA